MEGSKSKEAMKVVGRRRLLALEVNQGSSLVLPGRGLSSADPFSLSFSFLEMFVVVFCHCTEKT